VSHVAGAPFRYCGTAGARKSGSLRLVVAETFVNFLCEPSVAVESNCSFQVRHMCKGGYTQLYPAYIALSHILGK
jgi:hypothetical protein